MHTKKIACFISALALLTCGKPKLSEAKAQQFAQSVMREVLPELEAAGEKFSSIHTELSRQLDTLEKTTGWMLRTGMSDPNSVLAGSAPYLRMWGLMVKA